jgi:diguanylate cyclase (GGDEF)-like protein
MSGENSALVESAKRLAFAAEAGIIGIWDYDASVDSLHWNSVMHKLFDVPPDTFTASYNDFINRVHPGDQERINGIMADTFEEKKIDDTDYRVVWRDGSIHHIRARAEIHINEKSEMSRITGICYDISSQVLYEKKLHSIAIHDALTGLYNRQHLLELQIDLKDRYDRYTVLFIDLNGFKKINDSLGHMLGDRLLRLIAKKMQQQLRAENADIIRLGGDEYLVILYGDYDQQSIDSICNGLLTIINNNFYLKKRNVRVSASIGIASRPEDGDSLEDIIKAADLAMYHNKSEKQHSYERFNPYLKAPRDRLILIEQHLCSAIERSELELHYQPIHNLNSNSLHAIEALIRWNHPTLGTIFPAEFILIAQSNGYIHTIDRWVIDNALKNYQQLCQYSKSAFKISINISINLLTDESIYSYIKEKLAVYCVKPKNLILEITETTYTKRFNAAHSVLEKLHSLGVNIALDDFGVEYSSLKYLQKLPVDYLKIDRHFIENISHPTSAAIVETTVDLAKKLNIKVIAEGVETKEQSQLIQKSGCHYLQGHYFSPSITNKKLFELLELDSASIN